MMFSPQLCMESHKNTVESPVPFHVLDHFLLILIERYNTSFLRVNNPNRAPKTTT